MVSMRASGSRRRSSATWYRSASPGLPASWWRGRRRPSRAAAREVRRSPRHHDAGRPGEADLYHVALDRLREPDARIETIGDDVHELVLDTNLDLNLRMALGERGQETSEDERYRGCRHREPDAARDFTGPNRHGLQRLERLFHRGACMLE